MEQKVTKGNTEGLKKATELKKDAMIKALKNSLGIVSTACEKVGISRKTHYQWLKEDINYLEKVDEINEAAIEFVESKLMEKINGVKIARVTKNGIQIYDLPPSDTAITFYLKTKGKSKGYVEKQEIEHTGEGIKFILERAK